MITEDNSLRTFVNSIRADWGAISTEVVSACIGHMRRLMQTTAAEGWLTELHRDAPASRELHRDGERGFLLLAHTETHGLYRPPHDHGRSWVMYGIQQGELEICTYARVTQADGTTRLVKRDTTILHAGEALPYLPGDIHDTRCLSERALLLRFTERDLRLEEQMMRFVQGPGYWTAD
ncbi:MAG TPA: hypothetical protein VL100_04325 [Croceibacterium sp.]|nr:hypothetical protein [Croceibacterium sp.]